MANHVVITADAEHPPNPLRPAHSLGAVATKELGNRHDTLELNFLEGVGGLPSSEGTQVKVLQGQGVSLAMTNI